MKMAFIIYGNAIEPDVAETLDALGLEHYTKWREVVGKGKGSGPHLGTHVWPGVNQMMMIVLRDEQVSPLTEALRPLKDRFAHEGLKLYFLPAEEAL